MDIKTRITLRDVNGNYCTFDTGDLAGQLVEEQDAKLLGMTYKTIIAFRKEMLLLGTKIPIDTKAIKSVFANIKCRRKTLSDALKMLKEFMPEIKYNLSTEEFEEANDFIDDNAHYIIKEEEVPE